MRRRQIRFLQAILDQPSAIVEVPFPDHHDMMLCGCVLDTETRKKVSKCGDCAEADYDAQLSIAA